MNNKIILIAIIAWLVQWFLLSLYAKFIQKDSFLFKVGAIPAIQTVFLFIVIIECDEIIDTCNRKINNWFSK